MKRNGTSEGKDSPAAAGQRRKVEVSQTLLKSLTEACLSRSQLEPHAKEIYFPKLVRKQFIRIRGEKGYQIVCVSHAKLSSKASFEALEFRLVARCYDGQKDTVVVNPAVVSGSPPTLQECEAMLEGRWAKGEPPLTQSDFLALKAEFERVIRDRSKAERVGEDWWGTKKSHKALLLLVSWQYELKEEDGKQHMQFNPVTLRERRVVHDVEVDKGEKEPVAFANVKQTDVTGNFRACLEPVAGEPSQAVKYSGEFCFMGETRESGGVKNVLPVRIHADSFYDEQQPEVTAWRGLRSLLSINYPLDKFRKIAVRVGNLAMGDGESRLFVIDLDALFRVLDKKEVERFGAAWPNWGGHKHMWAVTESDVRAAMELSSDQGEDPQAARREDSKEKQRKKGKGEGEEKTEKAETHGDADATRHSKDEERKSGQSTDGAASEALSSRSLATVSEELIAVIKTGEKKTLLLPKTRKGNMTEAFHGTSYTGAMGIQRDGFRRPRCRLTPLCLQGQCKCQMLGFGVYLGTREKAMEFAMKRAERRRDDDGNEKPVGVVLRCSVDLGHCLNINPAKRTPCPCGCGRPYVDHLGTWYGWRGYDSVFVPDNCQPIATLREWCVVDPRRVKVEEVIEVEG